uniref:Uncharacterized protein n=1 Tax=Strongyloides venezuelensis TaxID=75913 RepID=A0A0K0FU21_STRVS
MIINIKIYFLLLFIVFPTVITNSLRKRENLENQKINNVTASNLTTDFYSTTLPYTNESENTTILMENSSFVTLISSFSTTQSTFLSTSNISSQDINIEENVKIEELSPLMDNISKNINIENEFQNFFNNSNGIFNVEEGIFSNSSCYYEGTTIIEDGIKREMTEEEMNDMAEFITKTVKFNSEWRHDEESNDWVKVDETVTSEKDSWSEVPCFCKYCSTKKE